MEPVNNVTPLLSGRTYDFFKQLVQLALPAAATLYFTLSKIWGLPNAEEVMATASAVAIFLGVILKISESSYRESEIRYDGDMIVKTDEDGAKSFSLELQLDPLELAAKDEIIFKVKDLNVPR